MKAPLIQLKNITKIFRSGELSVEVLKGIDLSVEEGEFLAIMGPSGSGKSTLMNIIGCLDRPTNGSYLLNGKDVSTLAPDELAIVRRHTFGFIFQRYNLISNLNALENVEVPAVYAGLRKADRDKRGAELLTSLGLGDRLHHRPAQLSGGQQQRVSAARALMNGTQVIMADEPTGALDSRSGRELMNLLHELHESGRTIILVTHDQAVAEHAQRFIRVSDGLVVEETRPKSSRQMAAIKGNEPEESGDGSGAAGLGEALKMAFRSFKISRFRTFLTMLGIIIGVGSVVAMLAIGNGAKEQVLEQIKAMGTNLLLVKPGAPGVRGAGGVVTTLVPEDAEALASLPGVVAAVPEMIQPVNVIYGNKDIVTSVDATSEKFPDARNWSTSIGTFFRAEDVTRFSQVVVLGNTVYEALFPGGESPLGKYVLIGRVPFQVIGVMAFKGADPTGNDLDDMIWVPTSTGRIRLFGQRHLKSISIKVRDATEMDMVQQAARSLLLRRHKTEDFQVKSMSSLIETASQTQNTLTMLLGAIAAISLMVGGIGVMNIMLVSVRERTREIGIRMAVGARSSDVLLQFLTEAIVVCFVGGVFGIVSGISGAIAVSKVMGWLAVFSAAPILIAFVCSFATGVVFGYLPARKAASLDPVLALATE